MFVIWLVIIWFVGVVLGVGFLWMSRTDGQGPTLTHYAYILGWPVFLPLTIIGMILKREK